MVIIFLLYNKNIENEGFETVCKNRQCFECPDKVYREDYCYAGPVQRVCPDGYTLDENHLLCVKTVTNENKDYQFNARPEMMCGPDQLQVGDACVTQAKYYFDPHFS
jgi:hypothetical protein